ncbi:MAG: TorF family putative porin [Gallionella sp.]
MMTRKLLNSLILAALAVPGIAMADGSPFSGNVSLTSDYLFRGITQTDHEGAIQGGFDYVNPNGFYVGVWGSNISWLYTVQGYTGGSSLELDTYGGYSGSFAGDYSYNVGVLRYNYGGNANGMVNADTNEIYGSIGWKTVSAKYSRSTGNLFGFADSSGSTYLELNGTYTLEGPAVDLSAHYGKQTIPNNSSFEYSDYNVKVAKAFGAYTWAFMVSNTNLTGYDKARGVLSVSHAM